MHSMTGFGSATAEGEGLAVRVEARTVNHRYLQVKSRVQGDYPGLDGEIEALVRGRLDRGSVALTVNIQRSARSDAINLDSAVAQRYRDLLSNLAGDLGMGFQLDLSTLVGLPGVIAASDESGDARAERSLILKVCGGAIDSLQEMRVTEGASMQADLLAKAKDVGTVVSRIAERMPDVVRNHQETLKKRISELLEGRPVEDSDLSRELAVIADRADVSEELSRLASHLDQFSTLAQKDGGVGRKLDFLMQEFMREANTIGSKCNDATVAHEVVELKTCIERLREQVQNVE